MTTLQGDERLDAASELWHNQKTRSLIKFFVQSGPPHTHTQKAIERGQGEWWLWFLHLRVMNNA